MLQHSDKLNFDIQIGTHTHTHTFSQCLHLLLSLQKFVKIKLHFCYPCIVSLLSYLDPADTPPQPVSSVTSQRASHWFLRKVLPSLPRSSHRHPMWREYDVSRLGVTCWMTCSFRVRGQVRLVCCLLLLRWPEKWMNIWSVACCTQGQYIFTNWTWSLIVSFLSALFNKKNWVINYSVMMKWATYVARMDYMKWETSHGEIWCGKFPS